MTKTFSINARPARGSHTCISQLPPSPAKVVREREASTTAWNLVFGRRPRLRSGSVWPRPAPRKPLPSQQAPPKRWSSLRPAPGPAPVRVAVSHPPGAAGRAPEQDRRPRLHPDAGTRAPCWIRRPRERPPPAVCLRGPALAPRASGFPEGGRAGRCGRGDAGGAGHRSGCRLAGRGVGGARGASSPPCPAPAASRSARAEAPQDPSAVCLR